VKGGAEMFLSGEKWNELFKTEQELINALVTVDITTYKKRYLKGYQFIESFQKWVNSGKELSPKQLTQLKRLAQELYKYHNWNW
jgi:hypothetical protein